MWYRENREKIPKNFHFNEQSYDESFYCAIKPACKIAKVFGLFPIDISSKNPQRIVFKWLSLRTFFSLIFVFGSSITTILVFKQQTSLGPLTARNIVGIIFFLSCTIICFLFFKISQKFSVMMQMWMKTESHFSSTIYQRPKTCWSLRKKVLLCTVLYVFASTCEHLLFMSTEIHTLVYEKQFCNNTDDDWITLLINRHLSFVIVGLPFRYNNFAGVFLEYLNFSYTFFWNFLDLFIILISIGISFLFEKINWRLKGMKGLLVNEDVWAEIRYHYVQVYELLHFINTIIGEMLLFACFIDGYFILVQLLNITKSLPFFINKLYFWYSLIFIASRTSATCLIGSRVQENAKYPFVIFRSIPTESWSEEVQRFFNQMNTSSALSGMDFFFLSKDMLFGMLGALITYELVLFQLHSNDVDWDNLVDCKKTFKT